MPDLNTFLGGQAPSPLREYVAGVFEGGGYRRVVMPCVGRFGMLLALRSTGAPPEAFEASDVGLFSSVLGYLADPSKSLDGLGIQADGRAEAFVEDAADELDMAAGVLVGLKFLQTAPSNLFNAGVRTEVWRNRRAHRDHVRTGLEAILKALGPISYEVADARDVVGREAEEGDEATFLFVAPPASAGRYTGTGDGAFRWSASAATRELVPEDCWPLLDLVTQARLTAVALVHPGKTEAPPEWDVLGVLDRKGGVDAVVCNRDTGDRRAFVSGPRPKSPKAFPIHEDEEITAASELRFVEVTRDTACYYRDLFVHRLGSSVSETHYLLLVDGRVVASLGFHMSDFRTGRSDHVVETFDVVRSSERYAKLNKLVLLARSSGDFKRLLLAGPCRRILREPLGVRTTVITPHPEDKAQRGIARMTRREKRPDGTHVLQYRAEFRDDAWPEVVADWARRYGHDHRPGWACEREESA